MNTNQKIITAASIIAIMLASGFTGYVIRGLHMNGAGNENSDLASLNTRAIGGTCNAIDADPDMLSAPLPFNCTEEIAAGEVVTATYTVTDGVGSLTIKSTNGPAVSFPEEDPDYPFGLNDDGSVPPFTALQLGTFSFEDVNFDGYKDLLRLVSAGAYNLMYDFYLYNPTTHSFESEPELKTLANPRISQTEKIISTLNDARGRGDIYTAERYELLDGKLVKVRMLEQDLVDYKNEEAGYVITESRLVDGKMKVVSKRNTPFEGEIGESLEE